MELNEQDRKVLVHTLTGSNSDGNVYRNYFAAGPGHKDEPSLTRLCDAGLMRKGHKINGAQAHYFHCTEAGAAAVGLGLPQDNARETMCNWQKDKATPMASEETALIRRTTR